MQSEFFSNHYIIFEKEGNKKVRHCLFQNLLSNITQKREAFCSVIRLAGDLRPLYRKRSSGIQLGVTFETFLATMTYLRGMTDIVSAFKHSRLHPFGCERSIATNEEE